MLSTEQSRTQAGRQIFKSSCNWEASWLSNYFIGKVAIVDWRALVLEFWDSLDVEDSPRIAYVSFVWEFDLCESTEGDSFMLVLEHAFDYYYTYVRCCFRSSNLRWPKWVVCSDIHHHTHPVPPALQCGSLVLGSRIPSLTAVGWIVRLFPSSSDLPA